MLILIFIIFQIFQNHKYTSGKLDYETLQYFWNEGEYKINAICKSTKMYPRGFRENGLATII